VQATANPFFENIRIRRAAELARSAASPFSAAVHRRTPQATGAPFIRLARRHLETPEHI
jgi:hypothetical protein